MKKLFNPAMFFSFFLFFSLFALFSGCDMVQMPDVPPEIKSAAQKEDEIKKYEAEGHYLKLVNLPLNTQSSHIGEILVANSNDTVAKNDPANEIRIQKGETHATAYVPLIYIDGREFIDDGPYFIAVTITVDAYTRYVVSLDKKLAVTFSQGRGVYDVLGVDEINEEQKSYLTITRLPSHVQVNNVSNVFVSNQAGKIGVCQNYNDIVVEDTGASATVKIPLFYIDGGLFTENGTYFVSFDLNIDAVTRLTVTEGDALKVTFVNGNALLDGSLIGQKPEVPCLVISGLPAHTKKNHLSEVFVHNAQGTAALCVNYGEIIVSGDSLSAVAMIPLSYSANPGEYFRDSGEFAISFKINVDYSTQIIKSLLTGDTVTFTEGNASYDISLIPPEVEAEVSYLTIAKLPSHIQTHNVADVFISNQAARVGVCLDYSGVVIEDHGATATVKVPLVYTSGEVFRETGSYFVSFDLNVDAVTRLVVSPEERLKVNFVNGNAVIDGSLIGQKPAAPSLTLSGLPANVQKNHFSEIFIHNASGVAAICADYNEIVISKSSLSSTAIIPLSYSANPGEYFRDSGEFIVSFKINVDAATQIITSQADKNMIIFTEGNAFFDISLIAPPEPPSYLTISGLPSHVAVSNIKDVFVSNQAARVALCPDYSTLVIENNGANSTVKIPLAYTTGVPFRETGVYFVSFDINVDALTRLTVLEEDSLKVNFVNGNAALDSSRVGEKENVPSFTIAGLPSNVQKNHISEVFVHNASGAVALCADYDAIAISVNGSLATAKIPLFYSADPDKNFKDSGNFAVSFKINVDITTQIVKSHNDGQYVHFTNGEAFYDIGSLPAPAAVSCLTLSGLPANIQKNHFSEVFVHNASGVTALCADYDAIAISVSGSLATAQIPLFYSSNQKESFRDSGNFAVSFKINVDITTQIVKSHNDGQYVHFTNGEAYYDIGSLPALPDFSYLTITNLPAATKASSVGELSLFNQAGKIGVCQDYGKIIVEKQGATSTLKIPLAYMSNKPWRETGTYFISLDINIDALTRLTVREEDQFSVSFVNGNALLDGFLIGQKQNVPCLTIGGLPVNVQKNHFSEVFVYNSSGVAAKCADYNAIVISRSASDAAAMIPLSYSNSNEYFRDSGNFVISFIINVDYGTQFTKKPDKQVIAFTDGSANFHISQLVPPLPVPKITIRGLPGNTVKSNLSGIYLYSTGGQVARCADYEAIEIYPEPPYMTASIPVSHTSGSEYFRNSGTFVITFEVNVDINSKIIKTQNDGYTVSVREGFGAIDLTSDFGYFSGGLTNPDDTAAPVVKKGTVFEMNGFYVNVDFDTPVSGTMGTSALGYVYAVPGTGGVTFEYSTEPPGFDQVKKAFYKGDKRALFKFAYLKDTTVKYIAKTFINDPWPHLGTEGIANTDLAAQGVVVHLSLPGAGNPEPRRLDLPEGAYIFVARGAGGGGNDGATENSSRGGDGGFISEMVVVSNSTAFTAFSGEGGNNGALSGGGGGGSGAFVFSDAGYLLCAGGGGGGGGRAIGGDGLYTGGGGGGAGGSTGSGAGGGGGGGMSVVEPNGNTPYTSGGDGGFGGGWNAGAGGNGGSYGAASSPPGINGYNVVIEGPKWGYYGSPGAKQGGYWQDIPGSDYNLSINTSSGGAGGSASYHESGVPWMNTGNSNGQGGNGGEGGGSSTPGGPGGNNRNQNRAGGAPGSANGKGDAGSVTIYKIF